MSCRALLWILCQTLLNELSCYVINIVPLGLLEVENDRCSYFSRLGTEHVKSRATTLFLIFLNSFYSSLILSFANVQQIEISNYQEVENCANAPHICFNCHLILTRCWLDFWRYEQLCYSWCFLVKTAVWLESSKLHGRDITNLKFDARIEHS